MAQEFTAEELEQGYYKCGSFKGKDQFQCLSCAFDALEVWRIRDHIINRHQMEVIEVQKKKQLTAVLYDSRGQVITEREVTDAENAFTEDDISR